MSTPHSNITPDTYEYVRRSPLPAAVVAESTGLTPDAVTRLRRGEVGPDAVEDIAGQIMSEVMAQLDDLSDDTFGTIRKWEVPDPSGERHNAKLVAIANDLRETLAVTLDQRVADWLCDATAAPATSG